MGLLLIVAGCLWRSYATIAAVHVDVLAQTADKLCTMVTASRELSAQGMAEYVYPAQRARTFLHQYSTYHEHPSYQRLSALVDRYEALVTSVDRARAQGAEQQTDAPQMTSTCAAVAELASQVREQLRRE